MIYEILVPVFKLFSPVLDAHLGNLELKDSNKLKSSDNTTVVKSYILAPKESLHNWDTH
jgi:hypothetical protein